MQPALLDILQHQQRGGFPDLAGTEASATIPISDRLLNEVIATLMPKEGRIREVRLRSEEGDRVTAEIRLAGPRFLPVIPVRCAIVDQPELPDRPVLGLRVVSSGLVAMAASLMPSLTMVIPGIAVEGDRIRIDIQHLLVERNLERWLEYVTSLRVTTRADAIVVDVRAAIRPR